MPVDLEFVRSKLNEYPNAPAVLCGHWFDTNKEPEDFYEFIKNEKRITGLFEGHDHKNFVENLGDKAGNVCIYHDGHYSYSSGSFEDQMWGFCDVVLSDNGIAVKYVQPECEIIDDSFCKKYTYRESNLLFMPRRDI